MLLSSSATSSQRGRIAFLEGLRAFAALFVVLGHAYLQISLPWQQLPHFYKTPFAIFNYGRYAVDLFIAISGFCLMLPVLKNEYRLKGGVILFLKKRVIRILPPYWLALIVSLLLIHFYIGDMTGTHWDVSLPVGWKDVASHFLLIHDMVGQDYTINHSLWSIAVEWRIYFLFPLILIAWRAIGPVAASAVSIIAGVLIYFLAFRLIGADLTAHYLGLFALGALAADIAFGPSAMAAKLRTLPWRELAWAGMALSLGIICANSLRSHLVPVLVEDTLVGLSSCALLVSLSLHPGQVLAKGLSARLPVFLGGFAYSTYLIHAPLLQVFWKLTHRFFLGQPFVELFATWLVGIPLIVCCCYGFYQFCEKPFLLSKKRLETAPEAAGVSKQQ